MTRRTADEIKEVAQGIVSGTYVLLDTEEKIDHCALPLLLGSLKKMADADIEQIGAVLGDATTSTMCYNGVPVCFSVLLIHKEDWPVIAELVNKSIAVSQ